MMRGALLPRRIPAAALRFPLTRRRLLVLAIANPLLAAACLASLQLQSVVVTPVAKAVLAQQALLLAILLLAALMFLFSNGLLRWSRFQLALEADCLHISSRRGSSRIGWQNVREVTVCQQRSGDYLVLQLQGLPRATLRLPALAADANLLASELRQWRDAMEQPCSPSPDQPR